MLLNLQVHLRYDRVEDFIQLVTDTTEKVFHMDHEAIE